MKKIFLLLSIALFIFPQTAFSFLDGGAGWANTSYLIKILSENIKRYEQLALILKQAKEHEEYIRALNAGIENSLGILETLPVRDEGILGKIRTFREARNSIQSLYGKVPKSKEQAIHTLFDNTASESIRMVNAFKEFSKKQEQNSQTIAMQVRGASPKGAQRMSVETNAQILNALSQLIRLNAQILKLQTTQIANQNKNRKDNVKIHKKINRDLYKSFENYKPNLKLRR